MSYFEKVWKEMLQSKYLVMTLPLPLLTRPSPIVLQTGPKYCSLWPSKILFLLHEIMSKSHYPFPSLFLSRLPFRAQFLCLPWKPHVIIQSASANLCLSLAFLIQDKGHSLTT